MAASTAGALKAYIEQLGLGLAVWRDRAGETAALPYAVVIEDIAMTPLGLPDGGSGSKDYQDAGSTAQGVREVAQVDLYQAWRSADGKLAESYTLHRTLARKLHGTRLMTSGTGVPAQTVYKVKVTNVIRMMEEDNNLVHHAFTLAIESTL